MAVDYNGALLLADAVKKGIALKKVLTVGHLDLLIHPASPQAILEQAGLRSDSIQYFGTKTDRFADNYLRTLGASSVTTLDASAYEGAEIVHDLNNPLPEGFKNRCDTLIDGGSLEHIFNTPNALKSYMELVSPGGHIIIHTPANNAFGHGFYQFSPELFFRTFSESNGFEMCHMIVHEMTRNAPMYRVQDPKTVGWRSDLVSSLPTYLFIVARKIADQPLLAAWPQQADYSEKWEAHTAGTGQDTSIVKSSTLRDLVRKLPPWIQTPLQRLQVRKDRRTLDTGRCFERYLIN